MNDEKPERKVYGFVVYIGAYSTGSNSIYENGTLEVMYGGVNKTFLGNDDFEPYKTEGSANRSRKSWEQLFSRLNSVDEGWRHKVGGVMPVTEAMYKEIKDQRERDFEIISNTKDPVWESLDEGLEKEARRRKFRVIK